MNDTEFLHLLARNATVSLSTGLMLLDAAKTLRTDKETRNLYDVTTTEGRAALAETLPLCVEAMRQSKKIVAIKELRTYLTGIGVHRDHNTLKNVKDAIDSIYDKYAPSTLPPLDLNRPAW